MRTMCTERLRLEPVNAENAGVLWGVLQQPDLRTYQDLPEVDQAQFQRTVSSRPAVLEPGAWGRFEWLIYLEGSSVNPVGWLSLRIGERSTNAGEVGYSVVQECRGRGIATEALRVALDEGFGRAQLRRMRAYCVPENTASRRVLERVGFGDDGILPHGATVRGRAVDVLAFVMERAQWEQSRAG
jgi:ribosomal-protein-alanine N-acetyltransferase